MTRPRLLIASCLLPALIAAGCGGDDDSGASQTQTQASSISKADYIARSDAICTEANKNIRSLNLSIASSLQQGDYQGAAEQVEASLGRITPLFTRLVNLPKPPGDEARLDELNAIRRHSLARIHRLANAFRSENDARIGRATHELAVAGDRSREPSAGYGFQVCGQGGSG